MVAVFSCILWKSSDWKVWFCMLKKLKRKKLLWKVFDTFCIFIIDLTWSYRKVLVTLTLGHKLKIDVFISFSYFWSTSMKKPQHFKLYSYNLYIIIILLISSLYAQNITDAFILHNSLKQLMIDTYICSIYQKIKLKILLLIVCIIWILWKWLRKDIWAVS